jgi:CHASE2 domain-containing sensor protein
MRLTNFIRALFAALFSRSSVVLIFWLITIPVCIQTMYRSSFTVGASALAACALCYIGAYGFMGSLLARREKDDRAFDRVAIGAIALVVIAAGSVLMIWSGFWMPLFDVEIGGVVWALLGAISAVVVRKADEINSPPKRNA